MGQIIQELLGHLFSHYVGSEAIGAGICFALAFWCFDWAVAEWNRRIGYSVLLWCVGAGIFVTLMDSGLRVRALTLGLVLGFIFYVPIGIARRRKRA